MKKDDIELFQILGVCIAFSLAGCTDHGTPSTSDSGPPRTLRGSFDVYYRVQTTSSEGEGSGNTPTKVKAIHFYEACIVIEYPESGGRVFPIDKIRSFSWK